MKKFPNPGVQSNFIEQGSVHLPKHHSNWRLKAIQKSEELSPEELMVSGQYSISKKDFQNLREKMVGLVKELNQTISQTEPEEIVGFNLDWFWLKD